MELNANSLLNVALFAILGIVLFLFINSITSNVISYSAITEYPTLVAAVPQPLSYSPIYAFYSIFRKNISTANNTVALSGMHGLKSLSTNGALTAGNSNLTVNCDFEAGEGVDVNIGVNYLGKITSCPKTFTNVSNAWINDPSTIINLMNNGTIFADTGGNNTAIDGGTGTQTISLSYVNGSLPNFNFSVLTSVLGGENISVELNGEWIGQLSGGAESWLGLNGTNCCNLSAVNNVTFTNPLTIENVTLSDNTTYMIGDTPFSSVIIDMTALMTPTCIGAGASISVTSQLEPGENVTFRFMGHPMGNLTGGTETFDPDPGWECGMEPIIRSSIETTDVGSLNVTNVTQVNITYERYTNASIILSSTIDYEYNMHTSNFTNASLSYNAWRGYTNYTIDLASANLTAGHAGDYKVSYAYGTNISSKNMLLGLIPLMLLFAILAGLATGYIKV